MATTLASIKSQAFDTSGLVSTDPRFPTAVMDRHVNRALRRLASERDWPWNLTTETLTTVAATKTYAPAATWHKTNRLAYNSRDLILLQSREVPRWEEHNGSPQAFALVADNLIQILPTPDGVYSIQHDFYRYENPLGSAAGGTDDTDTPRLPDRYMDYLIHFIVMAMALQIRDSDLYGIAREEVKDWRRRSLDEVIRSDAPHKPKTRDDWGI